MGYGGKPRQVNAQACGKSEGLKGYDGKPHQVHAAPSVSRSQSEQNPIKHTHPKGEAVESTYNPHTPKVKLLKAIQNE